MSNPEGPFYVIVGLGFSAVLNHLLLRTTEVGEKRLGKLPILHIGLPDPWADYDVQKMGQWPCLLGLPGFSELHHRRPPAEYLAPSAFAAATKLELDELQRKYSEPSPRIGVVEEIVQFGANFKVTYADPGKRRCEVVAHKIDLCTGPGPAVKLKPDQVNQGLHAEYFGVTAVPPVSLRRLLSGDDFLQRQSQVAKRVCVCGSGGTAAWCVERALSCKSTESVLWVSRNLSDDNFPPSGRNDHLLSGIIERKDRKVLEERVNAPRDTRLRMALGYQVDNRARQSGTRLGRPATAAVELDRNGEIDILFEEFRAAKVFTYLDSAGADLGSLSGGRFDQVVISIGTERTASLKQLTNSVMSKKYPIRRSSHGLKGDWGNLVVGLANNSDQQNSTMRILGPAFRGFPDYANNDPERREKLDEYEKALAGHAHGSQIPTGALSLAWAYGFFGSGSPNRNINTVNEQDLFDLGISDETVVDAFLKARKEKPEPFIELPSELLKANLKVCY